jgi:hypothetical protein
VSNPLSLADAVAEIERLREREKPSAVYYDIARGKIAGLDLALSILSRVTEPAELKAEVERLKAELGYQKRI